MTEDHIPVAAGREPASVIDIIVLDQFSMMSLAAVIEPLRAANRVSGKELYRWRLSSFERSEVQSSSGIRITVDGLFSPKGERDIVFVVAAFRAREVNARIAAHLRRAIRESTIVVGVEAGAWVVARSGLLDNYSATTHWEDLEDFTEAFPLVNVVADRFVMDRLRWTTGGAAPTLDLMLNLIRRGHGLSTSLEVARIFIYDHNSSGPYTQKFRSPESLQVMDELISSAIIIMEENVCRPLSMPAVAKRAGLSLRAFQVKFKEALSETPQQYYLTLRLAAAKRSLEQTARPVTEIAATFGFGSASAFARAFRKKFGFSPSDSRREQQTLALPRGK